MADDIEQGRIVMFTDEPLGVLNGSGRIVVNVTVGKGDKGSYISPSNGDEDWHLIAVETSDGRFVCPVHRGQFELVPTGPEMAHLLSVRAALGLEIRTGMRYSKGSVLAVVKRMGITDKRTKREAWSDLDNYIVKMGGPAARRKPFEEDAS